MGAQLTTDKLAPSCNPSDAIAYIILLKYRRGEPHLGATGGQTFEWGRAPRTAPGFQITR